ncbi:hypothetical protein [Serratia liquefaciens]|uniref:hypothetical protein n=1 Tax=Serratia liquefaciens TaxID=614 RepID=UPI0021C86F69|nr:hypothetical protein [Serratia liquefaciens]
MLDGYYGPTATREQRKRIKAVDAALEIAKASVGSGDNAHQVKLDLVNVAESIERLADAIQDVLEKRV